MIIWGTRGVESTKTNGQFYCPKCNAKKGYSHKTVRRYFTLYFIPLIPLDGISEFIECHSCRGTYRMEVLDMQPRVSGEDVKKTYLLASLKAMASVSAMDGQVSADEVETVKRIYQKMMETDLPDHVVQDFVQKAEKNPMDVLGLLESIAEDISSQAKEMLIRSCLLVAAADGAVDDKETEFIGFVADSLGVTKAHLNGIMAELASMR